MDELKGAFRRPGFDQQKFLDGAAPDLYPKLSLGARPLKGTEADEVLRAANLSALSPLFYAGDQGLGLVVQEGGKFVANPNAPIAKEVLDYLRREYSYGNKTTGKVLEDHFKGAPYGWEPAILRPVPAAVGDDPDDRRAGHGHGTLLRRRRRVGPFRLDRREDRGRVCGHQPGEDPGSLAGHAQEPGQEHAVPSPRGAGPRDGDRGGRPRGLRRRTGCAAHHGTMLPAHSSPQGMAQRIASPVPQIAICTVRIISST